MSELYTTRFVRDSSLVYGLVEPLYKRAPSADMKIAETVQGALAFKEKEIERIREQNKPTWENFKRKPLILNPVSNTTILSIGNIVSSADLGAVIWNSASPSSASALSLLSLGIISGVVNIGVAGICLYEGIQALKAGDKQKAVVNIVMAALLAMIGVIMILQGVILHVSLGTFVGFICTNPIFLAALFFLSFLPMVIDVYKGTFSIWGKTDYASQLRFKELKQQLEASNVFNRGRIIENHFNTLSNQPACLQNGLFNLEKYESIANSTAEQIEELSEAIEHFIHNHSEENRVQLEKLLVKEELVKYEVIEESVLASVVNFASLDPVQKAELFSKLFTIRSKAFLSEAILKIAISKKAEEMQAKIGVLASVQALKVIAMLIQAKDDNSIKTAQVIEELDKFEAKIRTWNSVQNIRFLQQTCTIVATILGILPLFSALKVIQALLELLTNAFVLATNFIPIFLDLFPFYRNISEVPEIATAKNIELSTIPGTKRALAS